MTPQAFAGGVALAAAAALFAAPTAEAANQLQIDVNSLTTTASAAGFSTGFTGSLSLSDDVDSTLAGVLINGVGQSVTGTLSAFSGSISLVGGSVTGGSFTVTVLESDAVTLNTYSASIVSGSGMVNTQAGQGFTIDGLTFMGTFSSSTFAGVDVTDWFSAQPVPGSFLEFAFDPGTGTTDTDSDIDIFVVVPLPATGGMGLAGLLGLATMRRRR